LNTNRRFAIIDVGIASVLAPGSLGGTLGAALGVFFRFLTAEIAETAEEV
jgi:hypothetical protein